MRATPPLIDQFGNINLHMEEDLNIPLQGGTGVGNLSVRTLSFKIPARSISRSPIANPGDVTGRIIRLTAKELRLVRTGDPRATDVFNEALGVAKVKPLKRKIMVAAVRLLAWRKSI